MTKKQIKPILKEMGISYDEISFISNRVPNLFFTFRKDERTTSIHYFLIDSSDSFFMEISKFKFYQLGQEALRA